MDIGEGRVLWWIHVRYHVVYWRHIHVGIVKGLRHRRRRLLLLKVSLLRWSRGLFLG
jgi:hypothetical protein